MQQELCLLFKCVRWRYWKVHGKKLMARSVVAAIVFNRLVKLEKEKK